MISQSASDRLATLSLVPVTFSGSAAMKRSDERHYSEFTSGQHTEAGAGSAQRSQLVKQERPMEGAQRNRWQSERVICVTKCKEK